MDNTDVDYEALLKAMPEMAKAVNSFTSEATQKEALSALLAAKIGTSPTTTGGGKAEGDARSKKSSRGTKPPVSKKKTPKAANLDKTSRSPRIVSDLDLRPSGKTSFVDFAAEKDPSTAQEKSAVAVFWLQHEANRTDTTVDHVYTAYREMKWKLPSDLHNQLQQIKAKKGWVDTSNMSSIVTTTVGENFVRLDLPKASPT